MFAVALAVVLVASLMGVACSKSPAPSAAGTSGAAAPSPAQAEFDRKWAALATTDVEAFYVEDDRGEGLMGNVRRSRRSQKLALLDPAKGTGPGAVDPNAVPEVPSPEQIQEVIRQNLAGVRACYLRLSRAGDQRSGKAIVSFQIGAAGDVQNTHVDAPAFDGTPLPSCVVGLVSHWAFPRSAKGGLAISYPFVFVGG
jgi:hypothetical protein